MRYKKALSLAPSVASSRPERLIHLWPIGLQPAPHLQVLRYQNGVLPHPGVDHIRINHYISEQFSLVLCDARSRVLVEESCDRVIGKTSRGVVLESVSAIAVPG